MTHRRRLIIAVFFILSNGSAFQIRTLFMEPPTRLYSTFVDDKYYNAAPDQPVVMLNKKKQRVTLTRFLQNKVKKNPELADLDFMISIQMACKTISNLVNRCGLVYGPGEESSSPQDGRFHSMQRLDQLSTTVLRNALRLTGKVSVFAPEATTDSEEPAQHQPGVLVASALDSDYVAVLDPLDGSGNADASICTGTVFGVFRSPKSEEAGIDNVVVGGADKDESSDALDAVLQTPAENMMAAGYCLYSSATVLVFTLGEGRVYGFTLDPQTKEFILTHDNMTIPKRGNVYSCNEANSLGWSPQFTSYMQALKSGNNQTNRRYVHRYVGSMVGDIHRTLLYGGLFCYPSDSQLHPQGNLQLLYKSAPMAFVVDQAGGKSTNGKGLSLLQVKPERIHQKSPCFMGSPDDIDELETYLN